MDFRWLVVVPASIVLGFLFDWLNVPAAWILAAIVASGAAALISQRDMPVNKHFYGISRGFIGIMAAVPLTLSSASQLIKYVPMGIAVGIAPSLSAWWAAYCWPRCKRAQFPARPVCFLFCPVVRR